MTLPVLKLPRSALAVADQAMTSLASVGAVLALLATVGRAEVGLLLWMLAPVYLMIGIQNATVISPYLTLNHAGVPGSAQQAQARAAWLGIILMLVCSASTAGFAIVLWLAGDGRFDIPLVGAFAMGTAGLLLREQERAFAYAERNVEQALRSSGIYCGLLLLVLVAWHLVSSLSALAAFVAMGVAGISTSMLSTREGRRVDLTALIDDARAHLRLARWALVGVFFAWVLANAYPIYIERRFGMLEVADVGVARLWLMPVAMLVPAFVNFFRPQMTELIRKRSSEQAMSIVLKVGLVVGLCCAIPPIALELIDRVGLFERLHWRKPGLHHVLSWSVYFFVFAARSMAQIFLLGDEQGYRRLSAMSFGGFIVVVAMLTVLPGDAGHTVVLSMALVEGAMALLILGTARRRRDTVETLEIGNS